MLQSAINVSEGSNDSVLRLLDGVVRNTLVDRHSDPSHNRSVFTLLGNDDEVTKDACRLSEAALERIDLTKHHGVHPRFGVVDVVPFVPFIEDRTRATPVDFSAAHEAATHYRAFAKTLGLATASYGLGQCTLPELRKHLATTDASRIESGQVNPTQGITAVGVREVLVAWNMWVEGVDLKQLQVAAKALRSHALRTLALDLAGGQLQLSCNVVLPFEISLTDIVQAAGEYLRAEGKVTGAELVGLLPKDLLNRTPKEEWEFLGLSETRTLEWQVRQQKQL